MVRFSKRIAVDLDENILAQALSERKSNGQKVIDGMLSNPTVCGIEYPSEIAAIIKGMNVGAYEPTARGLTTTREAVSTYYEDRGNEWRWVQPENVIITASTSEAYGLLFKLFGDAGQEVLFPIPGYPLVEHLASFEGLTPVAYPLRYDSSTESWRIDFDYLEGLVSNKTCALVFVAPNNPTGAGLSKEDAALLEVFCERHELPLIIDEVFFDYSHGKEAYPAPTGRCLTFVLNGLSKVVAMPQLKVGWIAIHGPSANVDESLHRLEYLNDYYLSASLPIQSVVSDLLRHRKSIQSTVRQRVADNYSILTKNISREKFWIAPYLGGWTAVLRLNNMRESELYCLKLLRKTGLYLHPGSFYGFRGEGWLVTSLLSKTISDVPALLSSVD